MATQGLKCLLHFGEQRRLHLCLVLLELYTGTEFHGSLQNGEGAEFPVILIVKNKFPQIFVFNPRIILAASRKFVKEALETVSYPSCIISENQKCLVGRMLVTLKNLQQQTFQIEISATDSVRSLSARSLALHL